MLSRLARRGWKVVYSPGPISWWERGSPSWATASLFGSFHDRETVSVYVEGRFPFRLPSRPRWDRWVVERHARQVSAVAGSDAAIVCLCHPSLWPIAARLRPRWLVYYPYDNFSKEDGWSEALALDEQSVLDRADLVVVPTAPIANRLNGVSERRVRVLPNGVDYETVAGAQASPCPAVLASIPRPRIAYTGVLNRKLDFVLVEAIAKHRPDWHWVFVGPQLGRPPRNAPPMGRHAAQEEAWRRCESFPNVHMVGELPVAQVHAGLHHMDVNVICNRSDEGWWEDAYPLKFHEYLAAGKPVVSTRVASIAHFAGVAEFVVGVDAWIDGLTRAIARGGVGTATERRAVARANDWDARVDTLESWLKGLIAMPERRVFAQEEACSSLQ